VLASALNWNVDFAGLPQSSITGTT